LIIVDSLFLSLCLSFCLEFHADPSVLELRKEHEDKAEKNENNENEAIGEGGKS
jgi:hypothetical protein